MNKNEASRLWCTRLILFFGAWILFLLFIQFPLGKNYDEAHYVPSAKQFLAMIPNQNYEHPPLGKELMAIGIGLFGDRPIGWRFMSTLAGAFTLLGMFEWALVLFGSQASALVAALLTFFNFLLYVQARIGMLDTFMMAFLVWGLALTSAPEVGRAEGWARLPRIIGGACFGLAIASKWAALFGWLGILAVIAFELLGERRRELRGAHVLRLAFDLGFVPVVAYFATFLPFLWIDHTPAYTLSSLLFEMQWKMYDGQLHVVTAHNYMSNWYGWPIIARPMWYAFERYGTIARGVLCMGNPFLMWGGLFCVLLAAVRGWRERGDIQVKQTGASARSALLIAYFYAIYLFCWAVVPRKISFYYYYYPAAMILSLAWVYALEAWVSSKLEMNANSKRSSQISLNSLNSLNTSLFSTRATWGVLAISAMLFFYYLPILAGFKIPVDGFLRWTWFTSWI